MLFTEAQLGTNPLSILDEATYLTESEAILKPQTVPVMEVSRLGICQIPFSAVRTIANEYGTSLVEAVSSICAVNGIDPSAIAVTINEVDIIEDPSVIQEAFPIIVAPISSNDPIYRFCEDVVNAYLETNDEGVFDELFNEGAIKAKLKWLGSGIKQTMKDRADDSFLMHPIEKIKERRADHAYNARYQFNVNNTDAVKANAVGRAKALANAPHKIVGKAIEGIEAFKNKPRNAIARKIASLRKLYAKFLERSQKYVDDERASMLRRAAFYITKAIDKLLGWLQNKANDVSYNRDRKQ